MLGVLVAVDVVISKFLGCNRCKVDVLRNLWYLIIILSLVKSSPVKSSQKDVTGFDRTEHVGAELTTQEIVVAVQKDVQEESVLPYRCTQVQDHRHLKQAKANIEQCDYTINDCYKKSSGVEIYCPICKGKSVG